MAEKRLTRVARKLRANQTEAEERLWYSLRGRRLEGEKFVRQFQIDNYVADFACRTARLAVELDGGQHSAERDAARTAVIETYGYRVLRFWNHDVLADTDAVLEAIRQELLIARNHPDRPPPLLQPSPLVREGRVRGPGAGESAPTQSPLTPTLSPPGRGSKAGADDEDGGDVGAAGHQDSRNGGPPTRPWIAEYSAGTDVKRL